MKILSYIEILAGAVIISRSHQPAASILGYILVFIGASYLAWNEEIRCDIDQTHRVVQWNKKNLLKKKYRSIPFAEVKRIFFQRVGKASTFTEFYCISIELNSGEIIYTGDRLNTEQAAQDKVHLLTKLLID